MLAVGGAPEAVRLGLRLAYEVGESHGLPSVRVGMHTGEAVEREGDFYGAAVNVAARVSAIAGGSQVLLSEATREAAGPLPEVEMHALGPRRFRNVSAPRAIYQAVWASDRSEPGGLPIDPVCRMAVDPSREAGRLSHAGTEFHFCSLQCAAAFAAEPSRYAG